ncbi:hypothetical protein [Persicobacter psychrovividus]|uniref:Uncharacterized protein n=1 Tax=Persicobacter psychrovividus TaxID=387638 RepID=A0ABN6LC80_9BACT|nr:hypothetical protein PEPS_30050 [Persicobacter psychrovividus]
MKSSNRGNKLKSKKEFKPRYKKCPKCGTFFLGALADHEREGCKNKPNPKAHIKGQKVRWENVCNQNGKRYTSKIVIPFEEIRVLPKLFIFKSKEYTYGVEFDPILFYESPYKIGAFGELKRNRKYEPLTVYFEGTEIVYIHGGINKYIYIPIYLMPNPNKSIINQTKVSADIKLSSITASPNKDLGFRHNNKLFLLLSDESNQHHIKYLKSNCFIFGGKNKFNTIQKIAPLTDKKVFSACFDNFRNILNYVLFPEPHDVVKDKIFKIQEEENRQQENKKKKRDRKALKRQVSYAIKVFRELNKEQMQINRFSDIMTDRFCLFDIEFFKQSNQFNISDSQISIIEKKNQIAHDRAKIVQPKASNFHVKKITTFETQTYCFLWKNIEFRPQYIKLINEEKILTHHHPQSRIEYNLIKGILERESTDPIKVSIQNNKIISVENLDFFTNYIKVCPSQSTDLFIDVLDNIAGSNSQFSMNNIDKEILPCIDILIKKQSLDYPILFVNERGNVVGGNTFTPGFLFTIKEGDDQITVIWESSKINKATYLFTTSTSDYEETVSTLGGFIEEQEELKRSTLTNWVSRTKYDNPLGVRAKILHAGLRQWQADLEDELNRMKLYRL